VLGQILWLSGLGTISKVGRRADYRHAQVRADAHGDHVLVDALAEADAGMRAPGNDVGQAIVDVDLDGDVGIVPSKPFDSRPQNGLRRVVAGGKSSVPAGFSRNSVNDAKASSMPSKCGATLRSNRSPASVGATLRVVRVSS
jgi:hypothetical protein